jgi:hypothetical protein
MLTAFAVLFELKQTGHVWDLSCLASEDEPFSEIRAFQTLGLNFWN